jgi:Cu(I)/Ag(I) efflux system membrane fusion protein
MSEPTTPRAPGGLALRAFLVRLRFLLVLLVTGLVIGSWDRISVSLARFTKKAPPTTRTEVAADEFYCPMHPVVVTAHDGTCPTCGMALSRRQRTAAAAAPKGVTARIQLSPARIAQAGVATSVIKREPLESRLEIHGTLELDDRRRARVAARVSGRVDALFAPAVGVLVNQGEPLAWIFNRKVAMMLDEFHAAERAANALESIGTASVDSLQAARSRLQIVRDHLQEEGALPDRVVRSIGHGMMAITGESPMHVEERAPFNGVVVAKFAVPGQYVAEGADLYEIADTSHLWLTAQLPADEAGLLYLGGLATITYQQTPDQSSAGVITFVDNAIDPQARTVRIVIDIVNPDGRLWAGGLATAVVRAPLGGIRAVMPGPQAKDEDRPTHWACFIRHQPYLADAPGMCLACGGALRPIVLKPSLAVPASAVIDTGSRRVVYRESSPGVFDAVPVKLGRRAQDRFEVQEGLSIGDRVATQGAFLLDAETRLDPAAAGAYFGALGTAREPGR